MQESVRSTPGGRIKQRATVGGMPKGCSHQCPERAADCEASNTTEHFAPDSHIDNLAWSRKAANDRSDMCPPQKELDLPQASGVEGAS